MPAPRLLRFDLAQTPEGWGRDVSVMIDGSGTIVSVTPGSTAGERMAGAAIPGLCNLHSHAFQRALAGRTERAGMNDDSFWTWREQMYRFLERMTPEDVEAIAAYAYAEMLEGGFTSVVEFHYLHHQPDGAPYDDPAEMGLRHVVAAEAAGIGLTLLPVFYAHGQFGGQPPHEGQRRFLTTLDAFARLVEAASRHVPPGRLGIAPHSLRAATPEQVAALERLAVTGPRHIHVAEQMREVEDCRAIHGTTPIRLLADTVALSPRWCLIHATHATPEEIALMADAGVTVGLCPITEANLGDGLFPAKGFLERGGAFGIGTDSNVLIDAAAELRQLEYGQRLAHRARNVLAGRGQSTGERLYAAALAGGATAAGLVGAADTPPADRAPGIRVGMRADIVVLDSETLDMASRPPEMLLDSWIFAARSNPIRDVLVGGRQVVAEGRHFRRTALAQGYRAALERILA